MKSDSKGRTINTFFNRSKDVKKVTNDNDTTDYYNTKEEKKEVQIVTEIETVVNSENISQNKDVENSVEDLQYELESESFKDNGVEDVEIENENTDAKSPVDNDEKVNEEIQVNNEVEIAHQTEPDPNDITTITKEIDRLNTELLAANQRLEDAVIEKDKNEKLYLELKDVLVKIGLTRELNILDDIKVELKAEQEKNQFLTEALKEKENFIESLKKGIFSGINQLFDQKPPNQIIGKIENSPQFGMIESQKDQNESVRNIKTKEEMIKEIIALNVEGKNLTEIAEITKLSKQKVNAVLKEYGKNEEKGA